MRLRTAPGVGVRTQTGAAPCPAHPQHVQEAAVLHQLGADVKQLGHAHGSGLAHIGVVVLAVV
jgi:hypothetical protein